MPSPEPARRALRCALAAWLLGLSAAAAAQQAEAERAPAAERDEAAEQRADEEAAREGSADDAFVPSERIDADTAVRFPADI